jgi:dCMP deaminase
MANLNRKKKAEKYQKLYMDMALRVAEMSYATRLKVGCIIVTERDNISYGWNGMPSGWDNECEYLFEGVLKTKPEVLHAEANALMKLVRSSISSENAVIYVTHAPCIECAKLIWQAGISYVYYKDVYRSEDGLIFLSKCGIVVRKINYNVEGK